MLTRKQIEKVGRLQSQLGHEHAEPRRIDYAYVVETAEALVKAEYRFRHGRDAYQRVPADAYVEAQEALRFALTGKRGLVRAFKALREGQEAPRGVKVRLKRRERP